jgi:hypothetical protein
MSPEPPVTGFGVLANHRAVLALLYVLVERAGGSAELEVSELARMATGDREVGVLEYTLVDGTMRLFTRKPS